ncbi:MAG: PLP-dependent aminotransferase family protein [Planctomycetales bacterium]|nr:PLP-dependent aminotransferase family protein [Planctomycetales bacterium]
MNSSLQSPTQPVRLSRRGHWTSSDPPISQLMSTALARPELISLAAGFVDPLTLPCEGVRAAVDQVLGDPRLGPIALQYGTTHGYQPLREQLIDRLAHADGQVPRLGVERCILTAGSNQLLQLVADALLDEGDIVLCAAPTYLVFLGTIAGVGATSWSVAADERGMIPSALEEALDQLKQAGQLDRVKAVYCVSYFDNPSGSEMDASRREEIDQIVLRYSTDGKIYLIDDLAYRDLRYEGEDVPSFASLDHAGDHVIVAGTFSKSFAPGVRVGWGLLPKELCDSVARLKGNADFGSPHLNQLVVHHSLQSGLHDQHVRTLREAYTEKRDAMLASLERCFAGRSEVRWLHPRGGLYVWLTLPEGVDAGPSGRLLDAAIERDVLYVPGEYAYATRGAAVARNTIRLSFGVQTPARIEQGIERLAQAVTAVS